MAGEWHVHGMLCVNRPLKCHKCPGRSFKECKSTMLYCAIQRHHNSTGHSCSRLDTCRCVVKISYCMFSYCKAGARRESLYSNTNAREWVESPWNKIAPAPWKDLMQMTCYYEGRLLSNAHSEISRKRDHVFKQMKVGSKVQYFSYKLTYLFFDIVTLSFNTFFPT